MNYESIVKSLRVAFVYCKENQCLSSGLFDSIWDLTEYLLKKRNYKTIQVSDYDDVKQLVSIKLIKKFSSIDVSKNFLGYVYRLVSNQIISFHRKKQRKAEMFVALEGSNEQ